MKYKIGFVALLLIYGELSYSQGGAMPSNFPSVMPVRGLNVNTGTLMGMGVKYNDGSYVNERGMSVAGTPLLYEYWNYGTVWMKTGEKFDSMQLKYDMLNDLLYLHLNNDDYQFKDDVSSFRITDSATLKVYMFRSGFKPISVFDNKSFYQVLYDGKTKFIQKKRKIVVSELTSTPGVKRDSFSEENTYYIVSASGEMKKLKKKNDDVLELLDGHKDELKKMIKEQKLKLNKDEDIVQLLHYYDQLEAGTH